MRAAIDSGRRILSKDGSMRRWASRAAWIPLAAAIVLAVGWVAMTMTGHRSLVVLTGSMEPVLSPGDVIVAKVIAPGDARPLDVVTFRDPSRANQLVTHRVVAMKQVGDRLGFLTKGDNNDSTEQWDVDPKGSIGRVSYTVPAVGHTILFLGRPAVRGLLFAAAFMVLAFVAGRFAWQLREPAKQPVMLAGFVLLGLFAGGVSIPATLAAFSDSTSNVGNSFAADPTFDCINPGVRAVTATADTWVGVAAPDTNHGSDLNLYARTEAANNKRSYVTFDLPAPDGCYVTSAWLGLYSSSSQGTRTMEARQVAGAWTEAGLTWNTQPATTGAPATRANESGWNYWDVGTMVKSMYAGSNHGFMVKDAIESSGSSEQIYNSREQATLRPTLYVSMAVNPNCVFPFTYTVSANGAVRDAWVGQDIPDTNNGNGPDMHVQSALTGANRRTLVTFGLPSSPTGCSIFAATLRLYAKTATAGRTLQAYRAGGAWTESQVKWNNQPPLAGTPATTASGAAPGWVAWEVTQQTQAMFDGANNGFIIKDATEGAGLSLQNFSTRQDSSNEPELIIRWG